MRCGMRNSRKLKVRRYDACIIDLNEYVSAFTGANESDKISETELKKVILNSMPNRCSKKEYVQVFS